MDKGWFKKAILVAIVSSLVIFAGCATPKTKIYTAEESWDHIGEYATVEYYVANPYRSGKGNVFLNEKRNYKTGFTGVIFSNAVRSFKSDPVKLYGYQTIRVTGEIKTYQGHPEIIIESPKKVKIAK